ncbi:MAG: hypothetical protein KC501_13410 [Myxococcales bacterium]|nr:hypothetical protein [Myxococcales bacterium]
MGNVHGVVGLRPCVSAEGALLPVRSGQEEALLARARALDAPAPWRSSGRCRR